jgi:thiol-disulfide isomerase/thioredoxin
MRPLAFALCLLAGMAGASESAEEILPFVRGSWQAMRQAHAGKPLVVHLWGVTCGPCRVELPHWGELMRERPDLKLVLIEADLVPNEPGAVAAMLVKAGLGAAESWMFRDGHEARLRFEIDPQWQGDIPRTILIARDGTATTLPGSAELSVVRSWLDEQKQPRS